MGKLKEEILYLINQLAADTEKDKEDLKNELLEISGEAATLARSITLGKE
jgi:hypothetical protein